MYMDEGDILGHEPMGIVEEVGAEVTRIKPGDRGAPVAETLAKFVGALPDAVARPIIEKMGIDRTSSLHASIASVRRGGTLSIIGVYGGAATPMPMVDLFDKQIQIRLGQANVKRWIDDIMQLLAGENDPLGTEDFATHRLPLEEAPAAYELFQKKQDGVIKIVLKP